MTDAVFPLTEPDHELFLVYGKGRPGIIRGMDLNAKVPDEYMIPIENLMNPRALDFHAETEFIYFADSTNYMIGRQKIDGTEREAIINQGKIRWSRGLKDAQPLPGPAALIKEGSLSLSLSPRRRQARSDREIV